MSARRTAGAAGGAGPSGSPGGARRLLALVGLLILSSVLPYVREFVSPRPAREISRVQASMPSKLRPAQSAAAASALVLPVPASVRELCGGLPACQDWHTSTAIARMNLTLILVGNEAYQQFPLLGYGGIETSVEIIAAGLLAMRIPFAVIIPRRGMMTTPPTVSPPYPFPVYDTAAYSNGKGDVRPRFVVEATAIIEGLHTATATPSQFIVWGQSIWSQAFAMAAGVKLAVVSHHDGNKPPQGIWDFGLDTVRHRFLSNDQRSRWVTPTETRYNSTRVIPHGLPPEDFYVCKDEGYYLWVASLDWGWEQKGMDIFVALARKRPDLKFIAYGGAVLRFDLVERAKQTAASVPNFEFRGILKRGPEHRKMFCGARAFFMPTQADIGESFGMTVIESISKGVSVIASTSAAVPELLGIPFGSPRSGHTLVGSVCNTLGDYEAALEHWKSPRTEEGSRAISEWARARYSNAAVVDELLGFSLRTAREVELL